MYIAFSLLLHNGRVNAAARIKSTLSNQITGNLQKFQVLLGDQMAIEDVVGAPFQIQGLTGEHLAFRGDSGEADFDNLSNRARQRRRQRGCRLRGESRAPCIRPDRQER